MSLVWSFSLLLSQTVHLFSVCSVDLSRGMIVLVKYRLSWVYHWQNLILGNKGSEETKGVNNLCICIATVLYMCQHYSVRACVTESQFCHCIAGDYIILKALPDCKLMK